MTHTPSSFDVIVIGGGAAGSSAALTLARARRSVVLVDSGSPRNAPADGIHGFITRDGMSPAEFARSAHAEVTQYGGQLISADAVTARTTTDGFAVELRDGRTLRSRRLIVTTGLSDELPDVAGLREQWGRGVIHCPYCHGWEVRDKPIGILATGPMAIHQALLFRQWTSDLILFTHTTADPTPEEAEQLAALGVRIVAGIVDSVVTENDRVTGLAMRTGETVPRTAIVAGARVVVKSELLTDLGLTPTEHPMGVGEYIESDATGRTSVPGVWVAGNVTNLAGTVVASAAEGVMAGATVNYDLITDDARTAVDTYRKEHAA